LVRAARRMAASLHAGCVAVFVETPKSLRMSDDDRRRIQETLRLAEQLGAEAVTLRGDDMAQEIVRYAYSRNVTKIVVGKPTHPRWRDLISTSFLDAIVRSSGDIDVYAISGSADAPPRAAREPRKAQRPDATAYSASAAV